MPVERFDNEGMLYVRDVRERLSKAAIAWTLAADAIVVNRMDLPDQMAIRAKASLEVDAYVSKTRADFEALLAKVHPVSTILAALAVGPLSALAGRREAKADIAEAKLRLAGLEEAWGPGGRMRQDHLATACGKSTKSYRDNVAARDRKAALVSLARRGVEAVEGLAGVPVGEMIAVRGPKPEDLLRAAEAAVQAVERQPATAAHTPVMYGMAA